MRMARWHRTCFWFPDVPENWFSAVIAYIEANQRFWIIASVWSSDMNSQCRAYRLLPETFARDDLTTYLSNGSQLRLGCRIFFWLGPKWACMLIFSPKGMSSFIQSAHFCVISLGQVSCLLNTSLLYTFTPHLSHFLSSRTGAAQQDLLLCAVTA